MEGCNPDLSPQCLEENGEIRHCFWLNVRPCDGEDEGLKEHEALPHSQWGVLQLLVGSCRFLVYCTKRV